MKITKAKLKQIIKEELAEGYPDGPGSRAQSKRDIKKEKD
jgi:hypothetical protein